jgi:hypothetical protein
MAEKNITAYMMDIFGSKKQSDKILAEKLRAFAQYWYETIEGLRNALGGVGYATITAYSHHVIGKFQEDEKNGVMRLRKIIKRCMRKYKIEFKPLSDEQRAARQKKRDAAKERSKNKKCANTNVVEKQVEEQKRVYYIMQG